MKRSSQPQSLPPIILKTWWDTFNQRESEEAKKVAMHKLVNQFGSIKAAVEELQKHGIIR
ncbi:hypothetical protein [Alteromonas oceanisediminis]|uniref:hypothetical protein n=1 Tax=Alteromonas oceanisediminis TaxID=2836180 RepID=UPI001BDAAAE6|nr:hypothetical protein [Alteromonas oceanisediminis]MBT0587975.1 hypothetical protein [Alteromonas oceanisediminis]